MFRVQGQSLYSTEKNRENVYTAFKELRKLPVLGINDFGNFWRKVGLRSQLKF